MEVLEKHSGNDASGPLLDCANSSLNLSDVLFGGGGVHNKSFHQSVYSLVEIHVQKYSM